MKALKGEIIKDKAVIRHVKKAYTYKSNRDFFVALIRICDELEADIPIWTIIEDRQLEKNGHVLICTDENAFLKIERQNLN